jgi:hypothetical protein
MILKPQDQSVLAIVSEREPNRPLASRYSYRGNGPHR